MPTQTIELAGIHIYPIKSMRGVRLDECGLERGRLVGDREWMLLDAAGRFMHQRDYPRMTRIEVTLAAHGITVRARDLPELEIRRTADGALDASAIVHVPLWRRWAPVVPVSRDGDAWFTAALGVPCRLMAFAPLAEALQVPAYERASSLQDATPFHLTTEESLADLNRRLPSPIPMNRFRPNLVVRGAGPYAEDAWRTLDVGGTTLRWIKPCTRCVTTMTDQETGERARREPLYTLATYRRAGPEVVFGQYLVADSCGDQLQVGSRVTVLQ